MSSFLPLDTLTFELFGNQMNCPVEDARRFKVKDFVPARGKVELVSAAAITVGAKVHELSKGTLVHDGSWCNLNTLLGKKEQAQEPCDVEPAESAQSVESVESTEAVDASESSAPKELTESIQDLAQLTFGTLALEQIKCPKGRLHMKYVG